MDITNEITGQTSDGYHTFDELYLHRNLLFIALLNERGGWAADKHHDGTMYDGFFIAGMGLSGKQIAYHLPDDLRTIVESVGITIDNFAPEWDGHTSDDVLRRIIDYIV